MDPVIDDYKTEHIPFSPELMEVLNAAGANREAKDIQYMILNDTKYINVLYVEVDTPHA